MPKKAAPSAAGGSSAPFDMATFRLKGQAATKDLNMLHIRWDDYTTSNRCWKEYNALKDKAHKGVNTACQHVLAGKIAEAKGAFAHAWQCRSACDWMFPPLMSWEPNPKDPDGSKHAFNAKCFEEMGQSLCTGKDGTPRADVDPALFEKFSKEYEKKKD